MRRGDIVINPWVSKEYNGKLNPMYATIYDRNNTTIDYLGRRHTWCDNLSKPETWEREWRVIGNFDFQKAIKAHIEEAVSEVEEEKDEQPDKP